MPSTRPLFRLAAAAVAVSALLPLAAAAATTTRAVTLDFEGVTSFQPIASYYAGGADGAGKAGTSNLGIVFSGSASALSNDALGPYFSHAPSPGSVMFATDVDAFLDAADGFLGSVSFSYSAASAARDVVTVWSGLDGTGSLLASFATTANAQAGGCSDSPFCRFDRASLAFAGTARSIGFGGNAGNVAFDDVALTVIVPVPEPATTLLLALGLIGLVIGVRRRAGRE